MDSDRLRAWVLDSLRRGWSPELIEGRLKAQYAGDPSMRISHECLCQWIYAKPQRALDLRQYLARGRKRRTRKKGRKAKGPRIPMRVPIADRPEAVGSRKGFGHFESDTVVGAAPSRRCMNTQVERRSRRLFARLVDDKSASATARAEYEIFKDIPPAARVDRTWDNGTEASLLMLLGMLTYFADPYGSWQRGVFSQVGVSCFVTIFFSVFGMRSAGRWFVLLVVRLAEHEGLADASAGAGEFDEASVVDDAVDDRGGEFVVGEDRPPFAELDVRGEDDAATFVAAGDDLVEETGPVEAHGRVAELVEDDQVGTGEVPEQAVEGAVAFGLAELEHELRGLPEPHAPALLDGEHAQGGGQVGLSASRLAVEHEVLRLGREIEAGQLLLGVSVGQAHVREVVAVEAFGHREPGLAHEPCPFGGLPVGQFRGEHAVDGVQLAGRGPFERFVEGGLRDEQAPRPLAQRAGVGPSVLLVFCFNVCSTGSAVFFRSVG